MNQRGFLSGVYLYVALAGLAVVTGLGFAVAYYKNSADRAEAEATLARDKRDRAVQAVKASEEANQKLKALNAALDEAIVERDKRAKELEAAKRRISKELDELRKTLPQEDIACLDRDLPSAILERLRVGPDHPNPR